jgi:phage terminase large subunit-like protein
MDRFGSPRDPKPRPGDVATCPSLPIKGREEDPLIPLVVAEQNQGGKMVKSVLHTADPRLKVKLVTASVGKAERAAPVAMLFEAGRVILRGRFPALEAEMLGMIAGGDYQGPGTSPDRADAMVWGLTELMLEREQLPPSVRRL